jgi:hypothetical protein
LHLEYKMQNIKVSFVGLIEIENNMNEFNTKNNLGDMSYEEYNKALDLTGCSKWIDYLHSIYHVVELDAKDCKVILKAGKSGVITQRLPLMYEDEIMEVTSKIQIPYVKCFARMERCSLKDGCLGAGPFFSSKDIVSGLCTSFRCYKQMLKNREKEKLFILPWNDMIQERDEFRVFVCDKRITAISQYNIHEDYGLKHTDLFKLAKIIIDLVKYKVINIINSLPPSFTVDVFISDIDNLSNNMIIEVNSFGKELAAGSCLFNWTKDHAQLYGKNSDIIEFRVVG